MNTLKLARQAHSIATVNLSKRRQWFADTDAATTDAATTTTTDPNKGAGDKPKTFTEADLERIVKERVSRGKLDVEAAKAALLTELAKEAGIDEADAGKLTAALKGKLTTAKKVEDANKSELEKAQGALAAAEKKAADAEAARIQLQLERQIEKRDTAITAALSKARAVVPDDTLFLMERKFPELVKAVLKDDGTIDQKAVDALVAKAKTERKQDFVGSGPGVPSMGGGTNPTMDDVSKKAQDANFRRARRSI